MAPAAGFPWTLTLGVIVLLALGAAGLVVRGAVRIWPSCSENAERASTSSMPALRAALITSVWTCET